jgi:tetratricopeptide (TPR) repeat protein
MEKDTLNKEWIGENLIFLVSQPRSGSTLLQRIIMGHPEVHSIAEPWIMLHPLYALKKEGIITEYDSLLARQGLEDFLTQIPKGEELYIKALRNFGSVLYNDIITLSGKKYFLDKTPRYYNIIPELYRVFTNAKFIFLFRNPLAIMSSVLTSWCGNKLEILKKSLNYNDLTKGPKYLVEGAKLLGKNGIVVHYEDLVEHPKKVIQDICAKIGLAFHEKMLEYGQNLSPKGRFGDTIRINDHSKAVTDYVEKWIENLNEPKLIDFANEYLSSLGPSLISAMGYSYQEIKEKLNAPIYPNKTSEKQIKKSQQKLYQPASYKKQNIVVVATSLAPRDIEIQADAIKSWTNLGIKVFSINCEEEIDLLRESFPQVKFIKAKRNGKRKFGKPYIFFDDFIYFFKSIESKIYGIINSDNFLISDSGIISFIQKHARNSLVYGSRVEIKSLENLDGYFYDRGFDFFFFDKSTLTCFPESEACIGVTWWDYWAAVMPVLENIEVKKLVSPLAYHITHQNRWDEEQWYYMGKQISGHLYRKRCENDLLKTDNKPIKIFDMILSNATHGFLLNRELGSEERVKISYGMLSHFAISILTFLEKMSTMIEYKSANDSFKSGNKKPLLSSGNHIASDLNEKGEELLKKGNLNGALQKFLKCIAIEPGFSKVHSNLGLTYWKIGDSKKALLQFKTALEKEPNNEVAITFCSKILMKLGKYEEARILCSHFLLHNPGNFKIGELLANAESRILTKFKSGLEVFDSGQKYELDQPKNLFQNTSRIKVSAIVSTCNSEKFILGCLRDLTTQTISDQIEIIIVDSGSQQNEGAIVKEFQKKYSNIKYIRTDQRETVYAAWNRGIKSATGKYITNANTDDRHRKDALEIMVKKLDEHLDVALVYADVLITETENETFENCTPVGTFKWLEWKRDDLLNRGCFIGPQPMWRRDLHREYGYFDNHLVTSGDYEYWLRISQTYNFIHLPIFLGLYLRSPNSIENSNRKRQVTENKSILRIYKNALKTGKIIRKNMKNEQLHKSICKDSLESKAQKVKPETLYKEIISQFSIDKPETTKKKLEKMLQDQPDYALAQNDLGVLYIREGHQKLALDRLSRAVNLEPENTNFRKNLADLLLFKFGELEEALQHYVAVLAYDPKDVEALSATGHICARLERHDEATEFYEKVLEIEPNNSDAIHWLGNMREKESTKGLEGNLNERYQTLITEIDHEDIAGTIQKIENFLEMYPKYGQAYNDLGVLYYKNESKTKVLAFYLKAVELEPENVTFRKNLADFMYVEEGRVQEALDNYVEVLRIKPDDVETLLITGHICTAIERFEDAMSFYHKVLDIEPQSLDARQNLEALEKRQISILNQEAENETNPCYKTEIIEAEPHASDDDVPIIQASVGEDFIKKAYSLFQQERIDQAVDIFLKAIAVNPLDGSIYIEMAWQLVNHGRHENALEVLSEMPENQSEALAMNKMLLEGYCQEGMGSYAAAKKCGDWILERESKNAKALNLVGIIAYRNDDKETADQHFKRAIELNPEYGEPHTNLGALFWEKGESKMALELYERGFSISPTDIDVANAYHEVVAATGEYKRAENVARSALKKYPQCRKVRYLLIDTLIRQEKTEAALKELEAALSTLGIDEGLLDTALAFRERVGKIKKTGSAKNPGVSLCMIVKDEEANLARCLASVKPIVDEMIVVDTGSIDRTRDIAEFFGARVYDYKWSDDFADARNFSLSKAIGKWILIMDADEVISSKDYAKFCSIVRWRPKKSIAYSLTTRNYCTLANSVGWMPNDGKYHREEASIGWVPSAKVRLFYGKDRIWFEGAVHEMVEAVLKRNEIPIKQCHIPIHHYGRLDIEQLERKGEKYFEIGKKKLEEMGENINAIREMAVQAAVLDKNEEAIGLWQRFLSLDPSPRLASEAFINLGTIYNRLGKFDDAFQASKRALDLAPEVKEAHNNFALAKFYLGNVEQAIPIFEELLKKFPGYLSAQFKLAAAYCCNGQEEMGKKTFEMLRKTVKLGHKEMAGSCHDLAKGLVSAQRLDYAIGLLNASVENNYVNDDLLNLRTECLNKKNETRSVGKIFRQSMEIHSGRNISAETPG